MLGPIPIPETQAPIFPRPRSGTSASVHWKCQVGRRIHLAREEAGGRTEARTAKLTREVLAQRMAIAPRRLWEIENGLIGIDGSEIALFAEALHVHPGYFFDDGPWTQWSLTAERRKPAWILSKTINELDRDERDLLEQLVIYFSTIKCRRK